jgi:hypothetical protein
LRNWSVWDKSLWFHGNHSTHHTWSGMSLTKHMNIMWDPRTFNKSY